MNQNIIRKYFPVIKIHYPNCKEDEIKLFDDGYDHDVLLINNGQTFRFPRVKEYEKKDHIENLFLRMFAKTSPVSAQEMISHTDPRTGIKYQTYKFIPVFSSQKKWLKL